MKRMTFPALLVLIGIIVLPIPRTVQAAESPAASEASGERYITIDFENVDIRVFIKYISELTGKNFIIDKAVQGNVTIVSPTRISESDAYRVFESVLEVNGFTTVKAGAVIKIISSSEARSKNVDTVIGGVSEPEDRMVTQLIPLKYSSPEEVKKILTPLVSKTSVIVAHTDSGMLILTDTMANVQRLLTIIEAIDVEYFQEDIAVIPLEHAAAASVAKVITGIYQQGGARKDALQASSVKVVPYERINALVVVASTADIERVKSVVAMLDMEAERGEGNIHVYPLQNATAAELIKVLTDLPEKQEGGGESAAKAPAISKNVKISADIETNSLVVTAPKEEYLVLEDVIRKLDIPRRMVYLEALILEVDTDKTFNVGVQWIGGGVFNDGTGQLVTGFSGNTDPPYNMIGGIDGTDPALPNGFSLGVLKQGIQIGGVTFPNIAAVLNAYKSDGSINIISTPQILTTDNKKAEISVGENVPYITSQNTTAANQDYTQYEYKDVSTKLTITPHINQADTLRLEIQTEVIKIKGGDQADQFRPTTFKRTADTTVILNDTDTVVIGGIIGQDLGESVYGIPLLSDIPLLGHLFKTTSKTNIRTNMFIFITPRIIRNPADLSAVTLKKEDEMSDEGKALIKKSRQVINPAHSMSLNDQGFEKMQRNKYPQAKEFFLKALENDPGNPFAMLNLGVVYEREGNTDEAIRMYQAVIATGTSKVAVVASESGHNGMPLLQIARENIEKLSQGSKSGQ